MGESKAVLTLDHFHRQLLLASARKPGQVFFGARGDDMNAGIEWHPDVANIFEALERFGFIERRPGREPGARCDQYAVITLSGLAVLKETAAAWDAAVAESDAKSEARNAEIDAMVKALDVIQTARNPRRDL